ncbi:MAG: efflux RND transporter permease subunit, partial [Deltaproteobacteria bacterium]
MQRVWTAIETVLRRYPWAITLAALIFAIGILVDDVIVVIENVNRHFQLGERRRIDGAIQAVSEVGNPTIIATLCVIAALLPMMTLGGLVGQWSRALPYGASISMIFSLAVTLTVTPYLSLRLLTGVKRAAGDVHDGGA